MIKIFTNSLKIISYFLFILTFYLLYSPSSAGAIVDPLFVSNNKFGIHVISGTSEEASEAATLVNSNGGDWGYITVLIERKEREKDRWQTYFDDLRRMHLIPIVRIATEPEGSFWKKPEANDAKDWAEFLNSLNWPVKNRYVVIYNEPNHGHEWGGDANPYEYAQVLNSTIDALKSKSDDFFVLNAGFDASTPHQPPLYYNELKFLEEMNKAVPGIFNKLDGWVSHSYPNPGFVGSPTDTGRGTVETWKWELSVLKNFGLTKKLPIFITETGWKHSQGLKVDLSLPSPEKVAEYYKYAFQNVWNDDSIVAVTPFVLNYQHEPFDHFSFKKITGKKQDMKVLGESYPDFYPHFQAIIDLPKQAGKPAQNNSARLVQGSTFASLVLGESYSIPLLFQNTGQAIWDSKNSIILQTLNGESELGIDSIIPSSAQATEPGNFAAFTINLKPTKLGHYTAKFQLKNGDTFVTHAPIEFSTEVKSPVILRVQAGLGLKEDASGEYLILAESENIKAGDKVVLNNQGISTNIEAKVLLPDQEYTFTLKKPFYVPKTIKVFVRSGVNTLDFGDLQPDFASAILFPQELWNLLPFSN